MEKSKIIEKLFSYIVTFSYLIIPTGLLFIKSRKKDFIPLVLAIYGLICFCLLLFYSETLSSFSKEYKKVFFVFYTAFEYTAFTYLFFRNIKSKKIRQAIIALSVSFYLFQVIYYLTTRSIRLDSIPIGIETILIFIYIFLFFYEFSKKTTGDYIYNHYCFWLGGGILVYLGGSFFFYILFNHLSEDEIDTFGNLTYLAEVIKNILFLTAMFIYARYPKNSDQKSPPSVPYLDMI